MQSIKTVYEILTISSVSIIKNKSIVEQIQNIYFDPISNEFTSLLNSIYSCKYVTVEAGNIILNNIDLMYDISLNNGTLGTSTVFDDIPDVNTTREMMLNLENSINLYMSLITPSVTNILNTLNMFESDAELNEYNKLIANITECLEYVDLLSSVANAFSRSLTTNSFVAEQLLSMLKYTFC